MDKKSFQNDSFTGKKFAFVDKVNDRFRCVFCKELYKKQFRLSCNHFICRNCKNDKRKGCPACDISHEVEICVAITDIERQIRDLRVRCSNQNCNYENTLQYFEYRHTVCKWLRPLTAAAPIYQAYYVSSSRSHVKEQITRINGTQSVNNCQVNNESFKAKKLSDPIQKERTYSEVLSGHITKEVPNSFNNVNDDINEASQAQNYSLNDLLIDETVNNVHEKSEANFDVEQIQRKLLEILNSQIDEKLENIKEEILDKQKNKSMESDNNVFDVLSSKMNEQQQINSSIINQLNDTNNAQEEIHNRNVQFEDELNKFATRYSKMESMLTDHNSQIDIKIEPIRKQMEIQLAEVLAKISEQNQRNLEFTKKIEDTQSSIPLTREQIYRNSQLNESDIMKIIKLQDEKITSLENDLHHLRIEQNENITELKDKMKVYAQHHKITALENSSESILMQLNEMKDDIKDNSTLISMCIKKSEEQKQRMNDISDLVTNSNENVEEMSRNLDQVIINQNNRVENEVVERKLQMDNQLSETQIDKIYTSREKNINDENLAEIAIEIKVVDDKVNQLTKHLEENILEIQKDYDKKFEEINIKINSILHQLEENKLETRKLFHENGMKRRFYEEILGDQLAAIKQHEEIISERVKNNEGKIKQFQQNSVEESTKINNVSEENLTEIVKEVDLVKNEVLSFPFRINTIEDVVLELKEELKQVDAVGKKQEELEINLNDQNNFLATLKQQVGNIADEVMASDAITNQQNQVLSEFAKKVNEMRLTSKEEIESIFFQLTKRIEENTLQMKEECDGKSSKVKQEELEANLNDQNNFLATLKQQVANIADGVITSDAIMNQQNQALSEIAKEVNEIRLTIRDQTENISDQLTKQSEENTLEIKNKFNETSSKVTLLAMKEEELENTLIHQQHMFAALEQEITSISEQVYANEATKSQPLLEVPLEIDEKINENMERLTEITGKVKAVHDRVNSIPHQLTKQIEDGLSQINQKIESDNQMMELNFHQFTKQTIEENLLEINNIYNEKFATNEDRLNFIYYHLSDKMQEDILELKKDFKQNEIIPIEMKWQKMEAKFTKYYEDINDNFVKEMLILNTKSENDIKIKHNFEVKLMENFTKFTADSNKILKENEDKLRKQVSEVKLDLKQLKSNSSSSFSPIELHPFHTLVYVWEIQQIRTKLKKQREIYTSEWFRLPGYPFIACGVFENQCCRFRLDYQADTSSSPTDKAPFKKVHPKVTCVLRDLSGSDKPRDVIRTIDCLKSKKNTIEKFDFGGFISSTENANSVYVRNEAVIFEIHVETPSLASKVFSHNGVLFDIVENYTLKKQMEKDYLLLSHKSPYFYTSSDGYRVQVFVCLHAVGDYRGFGLSAVVRVLTGENDFTLPNSLMHNVTFTIFNQHYPTRHLIRCVDFDVKDENFRVDFESDGFIESEGFVKNDALFYKVVIQKSATKKPKRSFLKK